MSTNHFGQLMRVPELEHLKRLFFFLCRKPCNLMVAQGVIHFLTTSNENPFELSSLKGSKEIDLDSKHCGTLI